MSVAPPSEAKRQEMIAALKHKREAGNTGQLSFSAARSPERTVLVPASSSPGMPSPDSRAFPSHRPNIIPSSNLARNGASMPTSGTPDAVMRAMHARKDVSANDKLLATLFDTPPAGSGSRSHEMPSPSVARPKTPSLVAAAQAQSSPQSSSRDIGEDSYLSRLITQFPKVSRSQIMDLARKHPNDKAKVILGVRQLDKGMRAPPADPLPSASALHAPAPKLQNATVKPRKNESSAIYGKRDKDRKKKRGSESESEGQMSDAESEMDWSDEEGPRKRKRKNEEVIKPEKAALKAFNEATVEELTGTIACSADQAATIIKQRPYEDVDVVRRKLTKARGVSMKLFEQYEEIMEGYVQIDHCLTQCERIASEVADALSIWRGASQQQNDSVVGTPRSDGLNDVKVDVAKVSELLRKETDQRKRKILGMYIQKQPSTLSEGTVLKDYQLLGVNWLNLLWSKKIGCILADEMGLGKTIQVIAFISHLKERGVKGPHLILVPASTLENWIREFGKFAPDIDVDSYYGSQAERADHRDYLKKKFRSGDLQVVLASYTQMVSQDDLSFFRKKIDFQSCIYDEGHKLKNCATKAYVDLLSIKPRWRLLLTGTPLQNNLQELISLLVFIHKDVFADAEVYLRAMFKSSNQVNLLAQQRVSRARVLLTPFVLRRRKAAVLSLPPKIETVEHCDMTPTQAKLYRETMGRSKKILEELNDDALEAAAADEDQAQTSKPKAAKKGGKKDEKKNAAGHSTHIIMDLRKAASHPLLFRRLYDDKKVRQIAKECLNTPTWCDSVFDYVVEDLEIMSDAELHHFCTESDYTQIRKFALNEDVFLEGGKVAALSKLIDRCKAEDKRMLLFSQFTMVLDILQVALKHLGVKFTRLDGQTKTDERQSLVDEFNEDEEITVFLLSTKAGGVGINLTAASVVVIYDQDFNPHNDRQAADRAYRIGQEKEVEVIKLITKDSIDEDMLNIGLTKLKLDDAVGGEETSLDEGSKEDQTAKEVRKSLITTLRNKFDAGPAKSEPVKEEETDDDIQEVHHTPAKVARAAGKKEEK